MQRDSFWIGWGTKDFILHKVHSGRALPLNCYFLSLTEHKIFFSSQNHMCNCQLCHCSAVQLCQPCTNCVTAQLFNCSSLFAHFLRLHTLLHTWTYTHLHIFAHLHTIAHLHIFQVYTLLYTCKFLHSCTFLLIYTLLHTCTFLHICTLFTLAHTFAYLLTLLHTCTKMFIN